MANIYKTIKTIKTIKTAIYSYDPDAFMPIYYDHKLANMDEFVRYKGICIAKRLYTTIQPAINALDDLIVSK